LHISERRTLLGLLDAALLGLALLLALWSRTVIFAEMDGVGFYPLRAIWWLTLLVLWFPLALVLDCYSLRLAASPVRSALFAAGCAALVSAVYLVVPVISAPLTRSRLAWFLFAGAATLLVGTGRLAYARLAGTARLSRRVLILGAGWAGRSMAKEIQDRGAWSGLRLVGFVDDDTRLRGTQIADLPVLGGGEDLERIVRESGIQDLVVAITRAGTMAPRLLQGLMECSNNGVDVVPMGVYYERLTGSVPAQHLGQDLFALVDVPTGVGPRLWDMIRRVGDVVIGIAGLVALLAIAPFIALAIVLDGPGGVLYFQERVGMGGRPFTLAKFRTMVPDAEQNGAVWAVRHDTRITRVGRFLRSARLDELPQFWNLVNGTMTLIGPRPERPLFVDELSRSFPYYRIRHSVRPGLTGWAQVRFRYGNSMDDALEKLRYDLYYIKHRGPALDAVILLYTLRVIARMEGC